MNEGVSKNVQEEFRVLDKFTFHLDAEETAGPRHVLKTDNHDRAVYQHIIQNGIKDAKN